MHAHIVSEWVWGQQQWRVHTAVETQHSSGWTGVGGGREFTSKGLIQMNKLNLLCYSAVGLVFEWLQAATLMFDTSGICFIIFFTFLLWFSNSRLSCWWLWGNGGSPVPPPGSSVTSTVTLLRRCCWLVLQWQCGRKRGGTARSSQTGSVSTLLFHCCLATSPTTDPQVEAPLCAGLHCFHSISFMSVYTAGNTWQETGNERNLLLQRQPCRSLHCIQTSTLFTQDYLQAKQLNCEENFKLSFK